MEQEQRDMANEAWKLFFEWLKKNPDGGIFIYKNLTLEVKRRPKNDAR